MESRLRLTRFSIGWLAIVPAPCLQRQSIWDNDPLPLFLSPTRSLFRFLGPIPLLANYFVMRIKLNEFVYRAQLVWWVVTNGNPNVVSLSTNVSLIEERPTGELASCNSYVGSLELGKGDCR